MNSNDYENFALVAPRPVRVATVPPPYPQFPIVHRPQARFAGRLVSAPSDAFDRLKLGDDADKEEFKRPESVAPTDKDLPSPRASPRSNLSSEALEEFLSILRPSTMFFTPSSPILRASNGNGPQSFFYRRPTSCSVSPGPFSEEGRTTMEQADVTQKENDTVAYQFKWFNSAHLSSPVSRTHTRNPFQRHPSYDNPYTGLFCAHPNSPSPVRTSPMNLVLSPAAIPLPLPTADEMEPEMVS